MSLKNKNIFILLILCLLFLNHALAYEDVIQSKPGVYGTSKNVNCPIEIIPGKSIGLIELGRNIKEIENLGMDIKSVQKSEDTLIVGRFSVGLNDKFNVMRVELEMADAPNCLIFNKQKIKKTLSSKKLSKIFKNCKPEDVRFGGNIVECEGVSISTGGWGGTQKSPQIKILAQ